MLKEWIIALVVAFGLTISLSVPAEITFALNASVPSHPAAL